MSMPASSAVVLPASGYRAMPWRNGRGMTTEIALSSGTDGRFLWRISIADVPESGPFSLFAGYDRLIAVVSGAGMRLTVGGRRTVWLDQDSPPYGFPGDVATDCTLVGGPIRDFNLMVDRASTAGALTRLGLSTQPVEVPLDGGAVTLLHALRGPVTVDAGSAGLWTVSEGDSLKLVGTDGTMTVAGQPNGSALLATIRAR
jgi:environmental stress-induced protein Ves